LQKLKYFGVKKLGMKMQEDASFCVPISVADPRGHEGDRKAVKVLKVEVKVNNLRVLAIFLIHLCLKVIACEPSERKIQKYYRFGHRKINRSATLGGGAWIR